MNFYSLVVLAAAVAGVASETVMVNTPTSVVACLPVQINWTGGQAPYFLSLIPGGQPSAAALEDLGQQTGTSYTWKADLPAGTALTVQIRDSNGQLNYSDQFTIQPGSTTCASGSGKSSGTSTSASPATTGTITPSTYVSSLFGFIYTLFFAAIFSYPFCFHVRTAPRTTPPVLVHRPLTRPPLRSRAMFLLPRHHPQPELRATLPAPQPTPRPAPRPKTMLLALRKLFIPFFPLNRLLFDTCIRLYLVPVSSLSQLLLLWPCLLK
ncbi:hypothetical protein CROQUDRAFT_47134 [Cronartium quercuum f. sp. fusiforme G11]|uniref:Yeast cell wall synthesis Kre9/Knh1-like N-terminal domain-containing protein n=1 Tax=Cronartium quercuum f. sp. fusiforme G11 TaxID=708437 RepID=A0A9P6NI43_9BASI|nr:hypothetical protein CROQUDRAFT_47134 [Cronartium quercuum f. sp. fusiforme G11]